MEATDPASSYVIPSGVTVSQGKRPEWHEGGPGEVWELETMSASHRAQPPLGSGRSFPCGKVDSVLLGVGVLSQET